MVPFVAGLLAHYTPDVRYCSQCCEDQFVSIQGYCNFDPLTKPTTHSSIKFHKLITRAVLRFVKIASVEGFPGSSRVHKNTFGH